MKSSPSLDRPILISQTTSFQAALACETTSSRWSCVMWRRIAWVGKTFGLMCGLVTPFAMELCVRIDSLTLLVANGQMDNSQRMGRHTLFKYQTRSPTRGSTCVQRWSLRLGSQAGTKTESSSSQTQLICVDTFQNEFGSRVFKILNSLHTAIS